MKFRQRFFLQGQCLAGNEEIVRRMHAEGHLIGNHTFHHVQLYESIRRGSEEEVVKTNNAIYEITGNIPSISVRRSGNGERGWTL